MKETYHFKINDDKLRRDKTTFLMPDACTGISLRYDLEKPYTMLVLLMIKDDKGRIRFQKQLSYSSNVISLSQDAATTTLGGIPSLMTPGEWVIEVIYNQEYGKHFDKEFIEFSVELDFTESHIEEPIAGPIWVNEDFEYQYLPFSKVYKKGKKWYKGDFHTHTQLSDGKELLPTVTTKIVEQGLDFYYATEHNLLHTGWVETPVMILPGMEMTTNYGHANVFGMTKRPESLDDIIFKSGEEQTIKAIDAFIKECQDNDWLFSINHPFLYQWKWEFNDLDLNRINCLEIINDPTYELEPKAKGKLANEQSVQLADLFWSQGYRICAIGGSDSHMLKGECYPSSSSPSVPGDPATWIFMDDLSPNNLKAAVKACHSFVTRFTEVEARFTCDYGDYLSFGDILLDRAKKLKFEMQINIEDEPEIFYIHNGDKVVLDYEKIADNTYEVKGEVQLLSDEYQWIRFGVNTLDGNFRFYGNPITKGKKIPDIKTFGQAREALGIEI